MSEVEMVIAGLTFGGILALVLVLTIGRTMINCWFDRQEDRENER